MRIEEELETVIGDGYGDVDGDIDGDIDGRC